MDNFVNQIICGDNVELLRQLPDGCIDLTVTSPPYDDLRTYKGFAFDFENLANELYRVTKDGGVVVWVVNDATVDGSETLTSFKQAIYFREVCGFNLHDTMIFQKNSYVFPPHVRYYGVFEYMFVFSKGIPKTINLIRVPTKFQKAPINASGGRERDGRVHIWKYDMGKETRIADNVWVYNVGSNCTADSEAYGHPAIFPEQLARDHIISWSNPGDLVLDPFSGSGTTAKVALLEGRNYLGLDISSEYCEIAKQRINKAKVGTESVTVAVNGGKKIKQRSLIV